jgi:hypothetical protein
MTADLLGQEVRNLRVARYRFDGAVRGVRPERVGAAFAFEHATV